MNLIRGLRKRRRKTRRTRIYSVERPCSSCGSKLIPLDKFCRRCGAERAALRHTPTIHENGEAETKRRCRGMDTDVELERGTEGEGSRTESSTSDSDSSGEDGAAVGEVE